MLATLRSLKYLPVIVSLAAMAGAQVPTESIAANQNRIPAGKLENGILAVHLELREGIWHPEAEDGPKLYVPALAEAGRAPQIPGPLLRVPEGTTVHVTVTNRLDKKATVYGLNTRPGDPKAGLDLAPGEGRTLDFQAGLPGTYYYWARTTEPYKAATRLIEQPLFLDAQMNGAFIVDPAGAVVADRVFVLNAMKVRRDVLHDEFEVLSINGKSYPFTEPLEYAQGEKIRWRVINPSFGEHPMHLHGAFYSVLSMGTFESDTAFEEDVRPFVVTHNLRPGRTMTLEWKPEHEGRWLFHCHFQYHMSLVDRVPVLTWPGKPEEWGHATEEPHGEHTGMSAMNDMAGLVLTINVKPAVNSAKTLIADISARRLDLVVEPTAEKGNLPAFACSVREGKKVVASQDRSMGPAIVLTRGELTEITVLNHLKRPTTIHWHGLELESYYDGVTGGGSGNQVTPAIAPGGTFTARFTPNRAGTFIYHTHSADLDQLAGGIYGPLIVLEPGEAFDTEHDKVMLLGSRDPAFETERVTLNGQEKPEPIFLQRGVKYRLRWINMAPNLRADIQLGEAAHVPTWRAIAKDGAVLPEKLATFCDAKQHIASGEAYDFEFEPETAGEIPIEIENAVNRAKLRAKFIVQ